MRFGSPEKARRELGFEAQTPIAEGLRVTIEWTREHLNFIESRIERHAAQLESAR